MSNLIVKFIDKEYSIPEDVLLYIDLLKLTDSVKEQLVRDFVREVSKSENGLIGDEDMSASINRQINRFISKLCENNIYNRTATDYLRNNKGKQLISDVNKAALNKMKSLLVREMDEWQSGFESALDKKESSVTGMGFSIWSGSFVNHAIYAAMQASTINKQEQAANKEYQKDMDALRSGLDAKYGSERSYYIKNDYIPNMETALTIFSYDLLDKYVSDLIENGKFNKSVLLFVDISRSNELLDNLKLSENKQAILENAFLSCPYNAAVYMATMRYDLLDYDTFQSAKVFKCDETIITFLKGHWGEVLYPQKFDINYHCIDLLALYTDKKSKDILHDYTKYYANSVVSAYSKIANMCTNEDLCSKAIRELSDNELFSGKNVAIGMAQAKVNSIVPDSVWKQLVNSCDHTDLFEKIKEVAPKNIEINTKSNIDGYFIEQLSIKFEIARQSIVAKINAQKEAEEKRKSIKAKEEAEAAEARKNKIKKAIIIGAILTVILSITIIVANVIKTSLHYKEQLSIIESSYVDGGYESAVSAIITSDLDESQKSSAFNDVINKTKLIAMDVYGLKSYVPEHWEVRLSDDGDIANGNYPHGDEDGGLQWYIQYEGEYDDIHSSGDAYWTDDSDYELTNIDHCTNAYVRYDSGKNNDGDNYMVIDYRVTCDSSVFQIQYFAYEDRYYEKEAEFLLEQVGFSEYKYSAEAIAKKKAEILEDKYSAAVKLMNQQRFEDAISTFEDIAEYKDSAKKITECETAIMEEKYSEAIMLVDDGKLNEAYSIFQELGDYKDASDRANSIKLLINKEMLTNAKVGEYINFGYYGQETIEWLVLEVKDEKMLVISKYAIDCKQYDTSYNNITWETCELRKWLNEDFLISAFSADERALISTITVSADKNPDYSTNPGNATQDKVFLFSIDEVNKYFNSNSERQCIPTDYAVANGVDDSFNDSCYWWLRTPGRYQDKAAAVSSDGDVIVFGMYVDDDDKAVRPALWIDISE